MKKLMFALLLLPFSVFSQTTLEEWNYVTKGLKIQKESGMDMKKGYILKEVTPVKCNGIYDDVNREIKLYKLMKSVDNKEVCLVLEWKRAEQEKNFYCIPHAKSEPSIWKLYEEELKTFNSTGAMYCLYQSLLMLRYTEKGS